MKVTLELPDALARRLTKAARRLGAAERDLVRKSIEAMLDELEDIRIAEERHADLVAGRSDTVSMEELGRRLGLED